MMKSIRKYISFVIALLSAVVLFFDFKNIINVENFTLKLLLYLLLIIATPIAIYSVVSLTVLRRKSIIIDNINLITVNHEFNTYKDLLKQTKRLEIQSVNYIYEFQNRNFTSIRTYKGRCISRIKEVAGFPLVVSGDYNATFDELNCFAYDLITDSQKKNKLHPNLISNEGLYKFVCYNFSHVLKFNQEFNIETHYTWPNCVSQKKDYILASPIFSNRTFNHFNVELRFYDNIPIRVKKYMIDEYKRVTPLGEIVKDSVQKTKKYTSFTDVDLEMNDNVVFFIYIYDFSD